ncbi:MAG: alpha/beta hydrolase [Anaerolineaceae bacterium]|jgi:pimeloyl-ACP methyl ester carboxylesterase|nr:alpha/beta hydrolase [Anaerolineaceae bacterium]HNX46580.1 alpha/beta hydrolase [Anaerolineaceae bacterium]HPT23134.1 alpha/beta hydrolase [Anaerolineaceae bacterium]
MKIKLDEMEMVLDDIGSGKDILLVHGLGLNRGIWRPIADLYGDQARFILPDMRGHGESSLGNPAESMEQFAQDLVRLLDALGIEKVVLGGHSMGGYIALAFAERYPERLEALAMIATNARADAPQKRADRLADAEEVMCLGTARYAIKLAERLSDQPKVIAEMEEVIAATPPEGLRNVLRAIAGRPNRAAVLAGLRQPLLVVAGREDKISNRETAEEMRDLNQHSRLVVFPGVGHMPMLEAPLALGALLLTL